MPTAPVTIVGTMTWEESPTQPPTQPPGIWGPPGPWPNPPISFPPGWIGGVPPNQPPTQPPPGIWGPPGPWINNPIYLWWWYLTGAKPPVIWGPPGPWPTPPINFPPGWIGGNPPAFPPPGGSTLPPAVNVPIDGKIMWIPGVGWVFIPAASLPGEPPVDPPVEPPAA